MSLKELHQRYRGHALKILADSVLLIYWGMLILGTFLLLN